MKQNKADRKNIFVTEYNCSSNNNIIVLENECTKDTLLVKYVGYKVYLPVLYSKIFIYIHTVKGII